MKGVLLMRNKLLSLLFVMLLVIGICFVPDVDAGTSTTNITNATYYVIVGNSVAIKLNGIKANKIKWSSAKKSIATVSKKGVITGVKKGKTTITGKYKSLKFQITVNVCDKDDDEYNIKDIDVKIKKTKIYEDDRDLYWAITFTFTNKCSLPTYFQSPYDITTYINNVEAEEDNDKNAYKRVKNGASVDVTYTYEVRSGDKIDCNVSMYNEDYDKVIVYSTSTNIP